ncbi:unnamed protein product, partial [Prorocentrum cordatum]
SGTTDLRGSGDAAGREQGCDLSRVAVWSGGRKEEEGRMRRADRNGMTSSGKRAWRVQGMLASGSSLSHSSHRLEAGIAEEGGLQLGPAVVCTRLRTWWC